MSKDWKRGGKTARDETPEESDKLLPIIKEVSEEMK